MARVKTEQKRREILEASAKVFSKQGFHAATVSQIAEAHGIGLGTFYRYFDSKLAVFHAVID
ncbi:MAG: helix-turn-helix transcriptional regulator, partial [Archangium sp.]|nr:helix-turn-helix transcriptional regulator [Archangium sp.]